MSESFIEQDERAQHIRDSIDRVKDAFSDMFVKVGAQIVGTGDDIVSFMNALTTAITSTTAGIVSAIATIQRWGSTIQQLRQFFPGQATSIQESRDAYFGLFGMSTTMDSLPNLPGSPAARVGGAAPGPRDPFQAERDAMRILEELSPFSDIDALFAHARAHARSIATVMPKFVEQGGVLTLLLPWDPDYESAHGEGAPIPTKHALRATPSRIILSDGRWWSRSPER